MAQDAIDEFIALPRDKQLSTLQQLSPEKQDKLLSTIKQRRSQTKTSTATQKVPEKSFTEKLTEIQPHQMPHSAADVGREVVKGVGNIGAAGMSALLHPIDTLEAAGKFALRSSPPGELLDTLRGKSTATEELAEQAVHHPLETAETAIGQAGATEGAGEVIGGAARGLKTATGRATEVATKTTPRETAGLVKETAKENEAAAAKAAEETAKREKAHVEAVAKQQEKRAAQVQQYGEKLSQARSATEEKQGQVSRKVALQRGVERLDSGLKDDLKATEDRVNGEANAKYNDLRKVLKDEQAPAYQPVDEEGHISGEPSPLPEHLYEIANTPLRGTETESTIIKSLGKRVQTGETTLTYNDLQGYREEIGRQLRKGTLEPDTYDAYKKLMPEIDRAMQQIADRHGLGGAQNEARTFYRRYAEAFLDRDSPIRKALNSTERGQVTKAFGGKDQSGIQRLAQFNPELAKSINTVRGYAEEARGIRPSGTTPKEPTLAPKPSEIPKPETVTPEVKKITPESIQAVKAEGLAKRARDIQHYTGRAALYVTGYRSLVALGRAATGDASALAAIPADIGEGIAVAGGGALMARVLESPKVVELLTKPTARDIAQVPPGMRGDLLPVIQAAQKRGVNVSPALLAAVTGSRNYPRGPNTRKMESLREQPVAP